MKMSESLNDEILAVKIKHKGQCPLEKGHETFFSIGFGIGVFVTVVAVVLIITFAIPDRAQEAINKGYAIYDPITGKFKWR